MNLLGTVVETFSAHKGYVGKQRPIVNQLEMIYGYGIEHDKFAGKNENRSVMIIGQKAYHIAKEHGIILPSGSLGENILLDFDPHMLSIGTVFSIGDVEFEITQSCTICKHLSVFDERLPQLLAEDRGLYCKILNNGIVVKDTEVKLKG